MSKKCKFSMPGAGSSSASRTMEWFPDMTVSTTFTVGDNKMPMASIRYPSMRSGSLTSFRRGEGRGVQVLDMSRVKKTIDVLLQEEELAKLMNSLASGDTTDDSVIDTTSPSSEDSGSPRDVAEDVGTASGTATHGCNAVSHGHTSLALTKSSETRGSAPVHAAGQGEVASYDKIPGQLDNRSQ